MSRRFAAAVCLLATALLLVAPHAALGQSGSCNGVQCGAGSPFWSCTASGTCTCATEDYYLVPTEEGPSPDCLPCPQRQGDLVVPYEPDRYECRCPVNQQFNPDPREAGCNPCPVGSTGSAGGYSTCTCEPGRLKCASGCVDPQNDDNHCGTCFNRCGLGQTCRRGQCICDRYYFQSSAPGEELTCQECDTRTTRWMGAPGQEQCVCELGYSNFNPATGACTPTFPDHPIVGGFSASNDAAEWQFGTVSKNEDPASFQPFTVYGPPGYASVAAGTVNCLLPGVGVRAPYACVTATAQAVYVAEDNFNFYPPPAVNLRPAPNRRRTVARFTIPSAGTWVAIGNFAGDIRATSDVQVSLNGEKLFRSAVRLETLPSGATVLAPVPFRLLFAAQSGGLVDFIVGDFGSVGPDFVRLEANVLLVVPGTALTCSAGKLPCAGSCANPFRAEANCGQCGTRCGSDERCCDGVCFDLKTDRDNCGFCGRRCIAPTPYCVQGECTY